MQDFKVVYDITQDITKVTHNNTGMYTKGSSQQTFEIPNNNLDVKFEKAYQKREQDKPQFMMVKFKNIMILMPSKQIRLHKNM